LNNSKIPKIIHQVWIGPDTIPKWCADYAVEMKRVHEELGWKYVFWGNEELKAYEDDIYISKFIEKKEAWSVVVDRLRLLILRDYGGVYIDVDSSIVKSLDHCLDKTSDNISFFCGLRATRRNPRYCFIEVSVLGSAKNSRMANVLVDSYNAHDLRNASTGGDLGEVIRNNLDVDTAVFNKNYFYSKNIEQDTIILHRDLGSWKVDYKLN
tara:strand:+ start:55 stop:684 length:630 start_codon:yes stop_codon:yes gene_type:complete